MSNRTVSLMRALSLIFFAFAIFFTVKGRIHAENIAYLDGWTSATLQFMNEREKYANTADLACALIVALQDSLRKCKGGELSKSSDIEFGVFRVGFDLSAIPKGHKIDSVVLRCIESDTAEIQIDKIFRESSEPIMGWRRIK